MKKILFAVVLLVATFATFAAFGLFWAFIAAFILSCILVNKPIKTVR